MLRSKSEIEKRLKALKSREKDGVDVSEDIEPLEWFDTRREFTEDEVREYAKECIDKWQYTRCASTLWILQTDYKNGWLNFAKFAD